MSEPKTLDEIADACQRGLADNPGWTTRRQIAQIRAALAAARDQSAQEEQPLKADHDRMTRELAACDGHAYRESKPE